MRGKGTVDAVVMRMSIREHIVNTIAPTTGKVHPQTIQKLQELSSSHEAYRSHVGHLNDEDLPDQSWRAGWTAVETQVLQLIEDKMASHN